MLPKGGRRARIARRVEVEVVVAHHLHERNVHLPDRRLVAGKERQVVEHEVAPADAEDRPVAEALHGLPHVRHGLRLKLLHFRLGLGLRVGQEEEGVLLVVAVERGKPERRLRCAAARRVEGPVEARCAGVVRGELVAARHREVDEGLSGRGGQLIPPVGVGLRDAHAIGHRHPFEPPAWSRHAPGDRDRLAAFPKPRGGGGDYGDAEGGAGEAEVFQKVAAGGGHGGAITCETFRRAKETPPPLSVAACSDRTGEWEDGAIVVERWRESGDGTRRRYKMRTRGGKIITSALSSFAFKESNRPPALSPC
jgi:hypothetical protein